MSSADFIYRKLKENFGYEPTECQDRLFKEAADFVSTDDGDILVLNGYAGTGKTSAMASIVTTMRGFEVECVLLAPTGRAAKVLSEITHSQAYTIHKHIYRQKSVSDSGFGEFSMSPNKARNALFIVDEVSLIGIEAGGRSSLAFGSGNLLEDLVGFVRSGINCKLILVGDSAQLPPVGLDRSPALAKEYMDGFGGVRYVTMKTVVRQQLDSGILFNATILRHLIGHTQFDISAAVEEMTGAPAYMGEESGDYYADGMYPLDCLHLTVDGFPDVERIKGGDLIEKLSDAYADYGTDETVVLCRSNKRAIRYNAGIRASVEFCEERLVRGDRLMIVKNCYQYKGELKGTDYIANGDMAELVRIGKYEERYGLHFAEAVLAFVDYGRTEIKAKVCLDTLESESPALTYEQQQALYQGVSEDYAHITSKKKRYEAVREDPFYNALQLKYASAITCHKSQGGQWKCVFIDNPFWADELTTDDLKWLYTALTRSVEKVYLVNFRDECFE